MFIRAWASHIDTATAGSVGMPGSGTADIRQFYYAQPAEPAACVTWWVEPTGAPPDDPDAVETWDMRAIVRHPDTAVGHETAQRIIAAAHATAGTLTDPETGAGYLLTQALALSAVPTPLGPDAAGNHEWSLVIRVTSTQ